MERAAWDPRVDVYFQPKAWADTEFQKQWIPRTIGAALGDEAKNAETLFYVDNVGSQTGDAFEAECVKLNLIRRCLPKNCTSEVQPTDAGLGRDFKREIGEQLAQWLENEDNLEKWESSSLSASDRRILLTQWVSVLSCTVVFIWRRLCLCRLARQRISC